MEIRGNYRYVFTVFTPTFNRCSTLPRVYESLRLQTFRNFEWLIVDDGSTDGTGELVEEWQTESDFPIRYIYQENQGKPAAFNRGVQEAQGELFLTLDSDDACVPHALERLKYQWDGIPAAQKDKFSAVTVLCKDQNGGLVGDKFPRDVLDSDSIELVFKYNVKGEKWGFHRTDVLKQFPFPTLRNAKFISEGVVWFAISRRFKTRFVNELIEWCFSSPLNILRSAINFSRYSFGLGKSPSLQLREIRPLAARFLLAISLPFGFVFSMSDKKNVEGVAGTDLLQLSVAWEKELRAALVVGS